MKKTVASIIFLVLCGASVGLPVVATAATGSWTQPSLWPTGFWGPIVWCTGNYINGANQCTNLCDLIETFINVIYLAMSIAIFVITPMMFLVGAVMFMMAGANPEMLGKGKKILTGTAVGLAIVLGSYLLVYSVVNVLGVQNVGGFGGTMCQTPS